MPRGIYKHQPQQGYQKGHKDFVSKKSRVVAGSKNKIVQKGRKIPDTAKIKLSIAHKGMKKPWVSTSNKNRNGNKHWNWKDGITPLIFQIRNSFEYRQWRSDVFARDNYTCQKCGDNTGRNLEAHHIKKFSEIMDEYSLRTIGQALNCAELWNINNGITYCIKCHNLTRGKICIK